MIKSTGGERGGPEYGNQTFTPSLGVSWSRVLESLEVLLILGWPRMPRNPAFLCEVWIVLNLQAFNRKKRLREKQPRGGDDSGERGPLQGLAG